MKEEEILGRDSKPAISGLGLLGGCALSITAFCSLVFAVLFLASVALNVYLAWTMSGYEVIISKPTSASGSMVMLTATSELALISTPTPTAVPDSVPISVASASPTRILTSAPSAAPSSTPAPISTQPTSEATDVTPTPMATQVSEIEAEAPETAHTSTASPLAATVETSPTVSAPAPEATTYVVQSDDTLWLIADREYGSGALWELIFKANRDTLIDPDRIWPGQELIIPAMPGED